jgi:predicted nucleic acid-binding protein
MSVRPSDSKPSDGQVTGFLLDTNVFNRLVDLGVDPADLAKKGRLFATHIQLNELQGTGRQERPQALLAAFHSVEHERVPTAAAVWNVSEYGEAEWGDADGLYGEMLQSLNARNGNKPNNARDILTAVTAHKRQLVLVTDDVDLATVMRAHGGAALSFQEFSSAPSATAGAC